MQRANLARESLWEGPPLAMTAYSRNRPEWHIALGTRAEATVRPPPWQLQYVLRDNQYDSETQSVVSDS